MLHHTAYTLLDFGNGRRLEQWGSYRLVRPDPTAVSAPANPEAWQEPDAYFSGEKGRGKWVTSRALPDSWPVSFGDVSLHVRLAPYKHTGVFPEQEQNWRWMRERARQEGMPLHVLNLFAYTGGATVALAKDGHFVTHVDASKPAIGWAKENAALNALPATGVRWILDDARTFVARERKRGKRYDAIVLDPPAYGHAPDGKTWRIERDLAPLLEACAVLLSDAPVFLLVNGYAAHQSPDSLRRLLEGVLHKCLPGKSMRVKAEELLLKAKKGRSLSTGIVVRCAFGAS